MTAMVSATMPLQMDDPSLDPSLNMAAIPSATESKCIITYAKESHEVLSGQNKHANVKCPCGVILQVSFPIDGEFICPPCGRVLLFPRIMSVVLAEPNAETAAALKLLKDGVPTTPATEQVLTYCAYVMRSGMSEQLKLIMGRYLVDLKEALRLVHLSQVHVVFT